MNGIEMKVKLKLPHLATQSFHFPVHICGFLKIATHANKRASERMSERRVQHISTATKKYCSSNANFIELFSSSAICALAQNTMVHCTKYCVLCILFGCWTLFLHFLVAIIACWYSP